VGTLVSYELDNSIATITMDDGRVNVLSPQMLSELNVALDRAAADRAVVVLTGRPGVFSAGFDLPVLSSGGSPAFAMVRAGFELAERILSFPAPVVIGCTGHAVAMGMFLLLSGDYRVGAAGPYKITANEVALGITMPWAAVEICRQRLTPTHLTRVVILAEVFSPSDAVGGGVIASPVLSADGSTVYVNGRDQRLWALHAADGKAKWSAPLGFLAQTPPAVTPQGLIVSGGGPDTRLTAFKDAGDHADPVWRRDDVTPLSS